MNRRIFEIHFWKAVSQTLKIASDWIVETLPEPVRFSMDKCPSSQWIPMRSDQRAFPPDKEVPSKEKLSWMTGEDVVQLLWCDGYVPEWIDLSVDKIRKGCVLIHIRLTGRFSCNESRYYHREQGYPPFHAAGIAIPYDSDFDFNYPCETRKKFSIYHSVSVDDPEELESLACHGTKVRRLFLATKQFRSKLLSTMLRPFPELRSFSFPDWNLPSEQLTHLTYSPKLESLSLCFCEQMASVDVSFLPHLPSLKYLSLERLPKQVFGIQTLESRCANLESLTLSEITATMETEPLDFAQFERLRNLDIRGENWPSEYRFCKYSGLEDLEVKVSTYDERTLVHSIYYCASLKAMWFDGLPLSDEALQAISHAPRLERLFIENPRITKEAAFEFGLMGRLRGLEVEGHVYPRRNRVAAKPETSGLSIKHPLSTIHYPPSFFHEGLDTCSILLFHVVKVLKKIYRMR
jgi:hypothetical protein